MKPVTLTALALSLGVAILAGACAGVEPTPTATSTPTPTATSTPQPVAAQLLVLSNDSPHVTVIDAGTNLVVDTADIPDFTKWGWNDDNNYFDGQNLWLGMKYPEADDAVVIALDLDTLLITSRLPIGKEARFI